MQKFALILILGILLSLCSCNTMQNDDTAKPEDLTSSKDVNETSKDVDKQENTNNQEEKEASDTDTQTNTTTENNAISGEPDEDKTDKTSINESQKPANSINNENNKESLPDNEGLYFPSHDRTSAKVIDAEIRAYSDLSQLYEESYAIVTATVTSADKQIKYNNIIDIAASSVRIDKVIKGKFNVGETIEIEETGKRNGDSDISIAGTPLLRKNMKVMLFLTEPSSQNQGIPAYGIKGCFYGKFFFDSNNNIHACTDFAAEPVSKLSDFTEPMKEATVLENINKIAVKINSDVSKAQSSDTE